MKSFFSTRLAGRRGAGGSKLKAASNKAGPQSLLQHHMPQQTRYESRPVAIPDGFLVEDPGDFRGPPTCERIDWAATPLPGNAGRYAVVLDNVLSPSECADLLRLVEQSVPEEGPGGGAGEAGDVAGAELAAEAEPGSGAAPPADGGSSRAPSAPSKGDGAVPAAAAEPWKPALVNAGAGWEVLTPEYRNSDRIIWDSQEIVDRLWARCVARAPELDGQVGAGAPQTSHVVLGRNRWAGEERWEFRRLNERMRFLRYGKGQFFRPHCDSSYREPGDKPVRTLYTLHLYLNDCKAEAGGGGGGGDGGDDDDDGAADLVGGATSFLSDDEKKRVDVDCRAGRVLIFQHRALLHAGDDVVAGTKYTMRTDIIYEQTESGRPDDA